jgi:hypothetical protein
MVADLDLGHTATLKFSDSTNVVKFTEDSHMSLVEDLDFTGGQNGIYMYLTNTDDITVYADDLRFNNIYHYAIYYHGNQSSNNTLNIGSIEAMNINAGGVYFNNTTQSCCGNC